VLWRRTAPCGARSVLEADLPMARSSTRGRSSPPSLSFDGDLGAPSPAVVAFLVDGGGFRRRHELLPPLLFSLCEAGIQLHKRDGGTVMADGCDGILQRPRRVVWTARERVGPPPRLCVQAEREDA
jgi:hypothetical protein